MTLRKEYLKEFLNWFWLRPENAILLAIRAEKYASTFNFFDEASLDVSCGDGAFSFIAAGGKFGIDTDMFQAIDISQKRVGNHDAFDAYDNTYHVDIVKKPDVFYSHGSDWKQNLLNKSNALGCYQNLVLHDNNKKFAFDDESFGYIYSNSTYWVDSFEDHINDLCRVLKPGGRLVLEIKSKDILRFSLDQYALKLFGKKSCALIDAGRRSTWMGLKEVDEYKNIFSKLPNMKVVREEPVYGDLMSQIWDIGLRPVFNPLAKLANGVNRETRREVKTEWCETFYDLMEHFIVNYESEKETAIEWLFVLEKEKYVNP
ncbi:methyltransferase domain-containing protein [Cohaesibacter gelatinilyticus]|uniref:Methyltransferase domain-containing protein n=1 Tax=Cohaesibacter gelatinilyticus TaxID=372072 RepID=A0A285PEJ4_9HYPH|nr:methyltransferase domain-containing protein [Cohaesibacter gelatinilyticus]SNZ20135.1 Methyltransferase domain-containing protein [Cohaesibacter gelatinilyticus]